MITTYSFGKKNTNNNTFFHTSSKPDYSKILDDIIITDIIDKNDFLLKDYSTKKADADYFMSKTSSPALLKATKFLANYKTYSKKYTLPYIIGKCYTLSDGTPIVFYENNIQIGYDFYDYEDFDDLSFLKNLTAAKKKTIIDIYIKGAKNININIL
jgi:hypothetical protein